MEDFGLSCFVPCPSKILGSEVCNCEVEANKRRAKERVRESKADERIAKVYIFCVAVPAWILAAFGCWVMWRLFL